jgi:hypothetical protein
MTFDDQERLSSLLDLIKPKSGRNSGLQGAHLIADKL